MTLKIMLNQGSWHPHIGTGLLNLGGRALFQVCVCVDRKRGGEVPVLAGLGTHHLANPMSKRSIAGSWEVPLRDDLERDPRLFGLNKQVRLNLAVVISAPICSQFFPVCPDSSFDGVDGRLRKGPNLDRRFSRLAQPVPITDGGRKARAGNNKEINPTFHPSFLHAGRALDQAGGAPPSALQPGKLGDFTQLTAIGKVP